MRRSNLRKTFSGALAAAIMAVAPVALAEPEAHVAAGKVEPFSLAAADAAGWLVFFDKRPGKVQDYSGAGSIRLRSVLDPGAASTPALAWLDHWDLVQKRALGIPGP